MGVDQLELRGLRHHPRDGACRGEQAGLVPERPLRTEPGQEPGRALEERRQRRAARVRPELVELRDRGSAAGHEPRYVVRPNGATRRGTW